MVGSAHSKKRGADRVVALERDEEEAKQAKKDWDAQWRRDNPDRTRVYAKTHYDRVHSEQAAMRKAPTIRKSSCC